MFGSVLDLVGGTPLVRLPRLQAADNLLADIALKLEFFNPLGSVKDRIGLAMVEAAELAGEIAPGKTTIVEPTSGNTGIALAFVAAAKGYKLIVVMPEGASVERRKLLRLLGAQVESTPAKLGMPGAIARADAILARTPETWIARQFDNQANGFNINAVKIALESPSGQERMGRWVPYRHHHWFRCEFPQGRRTYRCFLRFC
jgi:cysteine synthase A